MEQYISKPALLAEIQKRIDSCTKQREDMVIMECWSLAEDATARIGELISLQTFVATFFEVKKVNIQWEIFKYLKSSDGTDGQYAFAKHFFELGLKAQKED